MITMKIDRIFFYIKNPKFARSKCRVLLVQQKWYKNTFCKAEAAFRRRKEQGVRIGIFLTGGLGDYVIESAIVDEIRQMCEGVLDLYCLNVAYGNAVLSDRKNVNIFDYTCIREIALNYDVFICIDHWIFVWYFDKKRVFSQNILFAKKVEQIINYTRRIKPNIKKQCYREAVHFIRCEKLGLDRWTELRCGDVFKILDHKTYIPLHDELHARILQLGLSKGAYITINRGADSMGKSGMQTKVWPKEYYDCFVKLFKERFPQIKVVQLGITGNDRIHDVDIVAFDESIETVKWLLHDSLLHIDCEGGLVHLATQLDTKCIVLFGPTPLHMYGYEQNINLQAGKCHNCMGTHENWAFECFRGLTKPECMYSLKPELVMRAAEDFLLTH